jgi:hypothetical protein
MTVAHDVSHGRASQTVHLKPTNVGGINEMKGQSQFRIMKPTFVGLVILTAAIPTTHVVGYCYVARFTG